MVIRFCNHSLVIFNSIRYVLNSKFLTFVPNLVIFDTCRLWFNLTFFSFWYQEVSLRVLSGIQPSGRLHIGNFFGAMRQHLQLQAEHKCFYFIADYHALTSNPAPDDVAGHTLDVAMDYIALGLDTEKTIFWRQSDVPEVTELTWLLSCVTPMGLLHRCTSYKDKVAQGLSPNHGLFAYPVLQAADILIYNSDLVPVGADQKQHIEVTRDIAIRFNNAYGEIFTVPNEHIIESVAVVPGIDGRKMSKSYGNTIEIFEPETSVRKKIMRIVTDSVPVEEPKNPERCNVFALLKLVASSGELSEWENKYRAGGLGYGQAKKRLAELMTDYFKPYRQKRAELENNIDYVKEVLANGARRAKAVAGETLEKARQAVGLRR
jgi:tryptophanyl-tRNA synthetase